jgi:hypothetical protein
MSDTSMDQFILKKLLELEIRISKLENDGSIYLNFPSDSNYPCETEMTDEIKELLTKDGLRKKIEQSRENSRCITEKL